MKQSLSDELRIRHVLDAIKEIESFEERYLEIAWSDIIGFRNISIHEYFGVNFLIV